MPKLEVRTTEGVTLDVELAGAGTRFLAGLFDALIAGLGLVAVLVLLQLVGPPVAGEFLIGFLALGSLLVYIAYHVLFHWARDGQTPGKRQLGVRVVSLDGGAASLGQLVLRGVIAPVDVLPLPLPLGVLAIALSRRRQRLGDLAAGTVVVREGRGMRGLEPWARETWRDSQVHVLPLGPADVARFDRDDLAFLRDLATRRGIEARRRSRLFRAVAEHYLGRLGARVDADPRLVIKELYLFLREHLRR